MSKRYDPPKQSGVGQFFDAVFLLALVYFVLFIPLIFGLTGASSTNVMPETVNWETLGQNETMQAQWEKLGYTPETAAEMITQRFDYSIDPLMLIITAVTGIHRLGPLRRDAFVDCRRRGPRQSGIR